MCFRQTFQLCFIGRKDGSFFFYFLFEVRFVFQLRMVIFIIYVVKSFKIVLFERCFVNLEFCSGFEIFLIIFVNNYGVDKNFQVEFFKQR